MKLRRYAVSFKIDGIETPQNRIITIDGQCNNEIATDELIKLGYKYPIVYMFYKL